MQNIARLEGIIENNKAKLQAKGAMNSSS